MSTTVVSHTVTRTAAAAFDLTTPLMNLAPTALLGLVAAWIAYRQWQAARTSLQFSLYAQRMPVYVATRSFLATSLVKAGPSKADLQAFLDSVSEARFLYSPEMKRYLDRLWREGRDAAHGEAAAGAAHDPADRARFLRKRQGCREWLQLQYEELDDVFQPWLHLERGTQRRANAKLVALATSPVKPPPE